MDLFPFDDEYVRRLRDGDPETVNHFVRYFDPLLRRKLRGRRFPESDIDDALQDTKMRVLQKVQSGSIRDGHGFGAMVNTTCLHVAQEHERKRRPMVELDFDLTSFDRSALQKLVDEEQVKRAVRALEAFAKESPRDASIVRDLFLRGVTKDEVCREHGIERAYLRVVLHRAIRKLRELYDDS
jgi:RNA polymerase sigma-70 factor, ECF subfamily